MTCQLKHAHVVGETSRHLQRPHESKDHCSQDHIMQKTPHGELYFSITQYLTTTKTLHKGMIIMCALRICRFVYYICTYRSVYIHTYMYVHTDQCTYIRIYAYIQISVRTYVYMRTYRSVYVHTYIYVHTHETN